jgi:hypothetical protein
MRKPVLLYKLVTKQSGNDIKKGGNYLKDQRKKRDANG